MEDFFRNKKVLVMGAGLKTRVVSENTGGNYSWMLGMNTRNTLKNLRKTRVFERLTNLTL
ncbi:MAG: hypothetical protein V1696_00545 [Candidatus Jorgensenbacteria bacterium]